MRIADERALLARAQTSADGFGEFFDAYYDRIYAYAYRRVGLRENAEDIAAAVFEDALKSIKRLRWQNKPLAAWLYKIASRRVVDFYRDASRHPRADFSEMDGLGAIDDTARTDEYAAVRAALARLSDADRELIRLIYFDELDRSEVAAMLGCTANSVYVRVHRALKRLEKMLDD